jgi:hypothetical protein
MRGVMILWRAIASGCHPGCAAPYDMLDRVFPMRGYADTVLRASATQYRPVGRDKRFNPAWLASKSEGFTMIDGMIVAQGEHHD